MGINQAILWKHWNRGKVVKGNFKKCVIASTRLIKKESVQNIADEEFIKKAWKEAMLELETTRRN